MIKTMPTKKTAKKVNKTEKPIKTKRSIAVKADAGLKIDLYDTTGKVTGKVSLHKDIFGVKINPTLMAQAVRVYLANQRQGTLSTKTRSEVTGSTRKIYRQKGTGRARHGDIKAPIFIGGGIAHGPKPRDFSLGLSKTMKRKALFSALSSKLKNNSLLAVGGMETLNKKTKEMVSVLENLKLLDSKAKKTAKILLVTPNSAENLLLAGRNIKGLDMEMANLLNTYEVLNHDKLLFLQDSFAVLEKTFIGESK